MSEPSYFTLLLGWVLHLANAAPPVFGKEEFYALKDRLLRRFGEQCVNHDWQHISKPCWNCGGRGFHEHDQPRGECEGAPCRRCAGTGIYSEFWTQLESWVLGDERFHRPVQRYYHAPLEPITITGYVQHARVDCLDASEARLWLYLFFAPALWWNSMRGSSYMTPGARPMLALQRVLFSVRMVGGRWTPRHRCIRCRGWVFRPFSHAINFVCWPCERRSRRAEREHASQLAWWRVNAPERIEEDIPF